MKIHYNKLLKINKINKIYKIYKTSKVYNKINKTYNRIKFNFHKQMVSNKINSN